ncbi:MAG: radical SAM protein [Elusimicrobiota bacterium]
MNAAECSSKSTSIGKLCLLVSRRCNLRCGFCRVKFIGADMDWRTAKAGIEHYLDAIAPAEIPHVKFFGGEPLLNADLIHCIVDAGRGVWRGKNVRFEISTNGSFLDADQLCYFADRPEVEITVSQWAPQAARLHNCWFTMVIEPGIDPKTFIAKLWRLYTAGFHGLNFLPAYYKPWTANDLRGLRELLAGTAKLIQGLWKKGVDIRIKNFDLWSPVPLYNDAVTLDVDGSFYASNLVQCEGTERFHGKLRLGRIDNASGFLRGARKPSGREITDMMAEWAGPDIWLCTVKTDAILTEFVQYLKSVRYG